MAVSNLKSLIGKLNETCRSALESAAGLCLSQTHYEVDVEHFLIKLLEMSDTDLLKILKHFRDQRRPPGCRPDPGHRNIQDRQRPDTGTRRGFRKMIKESVAAGIGGIPDIRRSAPARCCWPCWTMKILPGC
jgi:hypothetical protein